MKERRKEPRHNALLLGFIKNLPVRIINISYSGCCFETEKELNSNTPIILAIGFDKFHYRVGEIMWKSFDKKSNKYHYGFKFTAKLVTNFNKFSQFEGGK